MLIHSILYYRLDLAYLPDHKFDQFAQELVYLQEFYADLSDSVPYHLEAFRGFTAETGFDLPLHDIRATRTALYLAQTNCKETN